MAKFYVQSGNFQTTINADDSEKAALWVIHKVMEQVMPFFSAEHTSTCGSLNREQGLMILGDHVLVSEQGFDNPNQILFDTFELQTQWQQLTVALAKLASMVLSAGPEIKHDEALCELV